MIKGNYRKLERLSSSDVRTFATKGRWEFYKRYILKEKEESDSRSMLIGNLVHCLLLEPEEFEKRYYLSICSKKPTGKMLDFVNSLFKHTMLHTVDGVITKEFKDLAIEAKKDSGYSHSLETILKNFKDKDPENYYRELRDSTITNKTVVCTDDLDISQKIVDRLKTSTNTYHLFKGHKEMQIDDFSIDGLEFKAMLDDVEEYNDYVIGSDLKVTWENEEFLNEYYLKKRADLQGLIYYKALQSKFPGKKIKNFRFIAADSQNHREPLIYVMNKEEMSKAENGFWLRNRYYPGLKQILQDIKWHIDTGNWTISRENYLNNGIIDIYEHTIKQNQ